MARRRNGADMTLLVSADSARVRLANLSPKRTRVSATLPLDGTHMAKPSRDRVDAASAKTAASGPGQQPITSPTATCGDVGRDALHPSRFGSGITAKALL